MKKKTNAFFANQIEYFSEFQLIIIINFCIQCPSLVQYHNIEKEYFPRSIVKFQQHLPFPKSLFAGEY